MAQAPLDPRGGESSHMGARVVRDQAEAFARLAESRGLTVSELFRQLVSRELEDARPLVNTG